MTVRTVNTCMGEWMKSGWTITPAHIPGIYAPLPPQPMVVEDILEDLGTLARIPPGEFQLEAPEDRLELADVEAAQQALAEYEMTGIEGTLSYEEYRAQRRGTEFSV